MWPKTLVGFFLGLLLSISLVLNLNLLLPFSESTKLMIGLVLAFPIWAGILVWSYALSSAKAACKPLFAIFIPSLLLNTALLLIR
ncbi:hypothetical protein CWB89_09900 [Pseudoalteromonas piscicida]|uniref:Uncharacterized protein n=1 Tax=Pseudoalteromonas piscicida TaxID=43662 RepID=A0AAQ2ERX8_PSEO7|nr:MULTISPECIES: hypothetical protein [Pseudoalteromonas]KJY87763.1 hypothetical protein TW75_14540 [Pseudoalteromonas piscicida]MDP4489827.1 hypothetical protein [Pseudoalteromonas piscicida]TMN35322.1 hypothetical protein CWB95_19195 [Pseudoalteromonas piscicida]TMN39173.1 hypothetical protein CWB94_12040 [Pseudoalteromonas piscicida]TMN54288.1 hypothetical protein CWB92_06550 [Pseudoalteromonas piscicida]